ncbi:unnamed protein product [Protopolystoma xenopodis]|uniref:GIY-YIG domain-containing protein n=1 Tax=Protopolystoma xenopodis TaxID=117903 RepID=A0A448XGZ1_9PLAT|nr:unnamed protein product [Protopolystoma xenopodis]
MAKLSNDADYDAGETSDNVPRPLYDSEKDYAYNELRNREKYDPLSRTGCYKILCSCGRCYVGDTCRPVRQRLGEHKNACKGSCIQRSEVAEHMVETGPEIKWSHTTRFADYGTSGVKRKIREATPRIQNILSGAILQLLSFNYQLPHTVFGHSKIGQLVILFVPFLSVCGPPTLEL